MNENNQINVTNQNEISKESGNNSSNKKNFKLPIIISISVLVVVFLCFGIVGFVKSMNSPFETAVSNIFSSLSKNKYLNGKYKMTSNISYNIKGEGAEELNKLSFKIESSYDRNDLKSFFKAAVLKDNNEVADLKAYVDGKKIYLTAKKIIDKVFYLDIEKYINNENVKITEDDIEFFVNKIEEALKNAFKNQKMYKESKNITINGKKQSVKDNYYIINSSNYKEIEKNMIEVYKNDETYDRLAKITGENKEDIKKMIESSVDSSNELNKIASDELDEKDSVKLHIYTKGLTNSQIGFSLDISNKEYVSYLSDGDYFLFKVGDDENFAFNAENKDNVTDLKFTIIEGNGNMSNVFTGKIKKINDEEYEMDFNIPDTISVNIKCKIESIKEIEKIDTSNVINIENIDSGLTDEDMKTMETNLEKLLEDLGLKELYESSLNSSLVYPDDKSYEGYDYNNDYNYKYNDNGLFITN